MSRAGYDWLDLLDAEVALTRGDYDPDPSPPPPPLRGTRTRHPTKARSSDWMRRAACRGETGTFFPAWGHGLDEAREMCARCPVRGACLDYALSLRATDTRWGAWAGLSGDDLRELRRERRKAA